MLFDVETMKRAMVEFELDLTKMPLGKLSKKQLEKAYGILSQVTGSCFKRGIVLTLVIRLKSCWMPRTFTRPNSSTFPTSFTR